MSRRSVSLFILSAVVACASATPTPRSETPSTESSSSRGAPAAQPTQPEPKDTRPRYTVNAKPWAEVFIDGRSVGHTPVEARLAPGRYVVAVAWEDHCHSWSVVLEEGDWKSAFIPHDPGVPIGKGCPRDRFPTAASAKDAPGPPLATVTDDAIEITQQVQFDHDKATIKPESHEVLDAVVKLLVDHPDIRLEVQGHTDDTGLATRNQTLSQERPASRMPQAARARAGT